MIHIYGLQPNWRSDALGNDRENTPLPAIPMRAPRELGVRQFVALDANQHGANVRDLVVAWASAAGPQTVPRNLHRHCRQAASAMEATIPASNVSQENLHGSAAGWNPRPNGHLETFEFGSSRQPSNGRRRNLDGLWGPQPRRRKIWLATVQKAHARTT